MAVLGVVVAIAVGMVVSFKMRVEAVRVSASLAARVERVSNE